MQPITLLQEAGGRFYPAYTQPNPGLAEGRLRHAHIA